MSEEAKSYDPHRGDVHPAFGVDVHFGRSWSGSPLEDECPCEQAPCGLVTWSRIDADCPEHAAKAMKSIRQSHRVDECPGERS